MGMLSAYLRLLMFLLAILIPACASSSLAFLMMYSAYKLNKQGDNIQPWHTPFPIWNQSLVPHPVLTVASWLAHRFLRKQVRWSDIPISLRRDECLNAKFRLQLKKAGKTSRSFRYDLNQIPYDYTVEVTNRFKGLDLRQSAWRTMDGGS